MMLSGWELWRAGSMKHAERGGKWWPSPAGARPPRLRTLQCAQVTNAPRANAEMMLTALGLDAAFEVGAVP